jgi:putative AdoMet-dependent methyltransferase
MKVREMDVELYRNYMNGLNGKAEPGWQYDEAKPCGVNYNDIWHAWAYDRRQQVFRDYKTESKDIIALLGLDKNQKVIDMGCGTGAFAINAAKHLKKVYAVDVSNAMLRRARKKARKAKLDNIEFSKGGFLTYTHNAEPVDAIVSMSALHHLPDFWKMIGLQRLARMVKTGGKVYIKDVVFSFDLARYNSRIKAFIQIMINRTEPGMKWDLETHFRQEYSTCGWIMEGLLERAGFRIDKADYKDDFFATYLCTKKGK